MSDGLSMTADLRKFEREIAAFAGRIDDMEPVADDFGARMVRTWTLKFPRTSGHEASAPGAPPAVQNAGLRNSLTHEVRHGGDEVEMGTPLVYGAIQHEGGVIRPVRAKALTVPIHPKARGKRARDFDDLRFVPIPNAGSTGNLVGLLVKGTKKRIAGKTYHGEEAYFALMDRVELPARPWRIIYPEDVEYLGRRMERHLEK